VVGKQVRADEYLV